MKKKDHMKKEILRYKARFLLVLSLLIGLHQEFPDRISRAVVDAKIDEILKAKYPKEVLDVRHRRLYDKYRLDWEDAAFGKRDNCEVILTKIIPIRDLTLDELDVRALEYIKLQKQAILKSWKVEKALNLTTEKGNVFDLTPSLELLDEHERDILNGRRRRKNRSIKI